MKRIAAKHKDADGIYMLGSAWKSVESSTAWRETPA